MMSSITREKARKALQLAGRTDVYLFGLFEQLALMRASGGLKPSLFILGLPRSGTTLIYQYIVHRLKIAYFPNSVGRYFMSPCLATWWTWKMNDVYRSDFESSYGTVEGPLAPHEAGKFWGRFFGFEEYVRYDDLSERARRTMRRTVGCIQHVFGDLPFVNKNVKHMLRIDALHEIFPQSYFLIVRRNLGDVALSLLRARYANVDDLRQWWSVRPPNHRVLTDLPVAEQIARQLQALDERLARDLDELPEERMMHVDYGTFCDHPDRTIEPIRQKLGCAVTENTPVEYFSRSTNEPTTGEEEQLLAIISGRDTR